MIREDKSRWVSGYEVFVETRLRQLNANRFALVTLPERIAALRSRLASIKATRTDSDKVHGSTTSGEEAMLNAITEIDAAEHSLKYARIETKQMDKALEILTEKERKIVDSFYITQSQRSLSDLCAEIGYEQAQIYRIKRAAINKLGNYLYGTMHSGK